MNPAIYCVHLESSTGRRERMESRFSHHGFDRATFVPAFAYDAPRNASDEWKAMAGRHALASHVEAMRRILEEVPESEGGALICEDDVIFHDEIGERLPDALANLPEDAGLMMVGFMVYGWPGGLVWSGRDPGRHNLIEVVPWTTWGAHAYWITHRYARELVDRLGDAEIEDLGNVVEENITFFSNGHAAYPPLMLQETIDSVVRKDAELSVHVGMQSAWPYSDYAAAEAEPPLSPLASLPDPTRAVGVSVTVRDPSDDAAGLRASLEGLVSDEAPDYVLHLDSDMKVEWLGPLPPLTADAYRIAVAGQDPIVALVRSDLEGEPQHVHDLEALKLTRGDLFENLVDARFASHRGELELEGVGLGAVDLGEGATLALEDDDRGLHRLIKRDRAGTALEASPSFRFADGHREESTGIAAADGMLVLGFLADGRHAALAACELDAAISLLRPAP